MTPRLAVHVVYALVGATLLVACHRGGGTSDEEESPPPPVLVHCVAPHPEAIDETVVLRGRLAPPPGGDLPVASQVQGRVVEVAVHEGQRITKGALVASIDDAPSRDVTRQAEAALAQAQASEANAKATMDRTNALVARGIAARQEQDDAVARAEAARASVTSAEAALDTARRTLGRVQVHSSFDGVVTRVWRGPGALVDGTAATPIVQLAASNAVELVADATERDLALVRAGAVARGAIDATGVTFDAVVRTASTALDPATGLGAVRLAIAGDAPGPIGAFARVVVTTQHRDGVPVLPSTALRGAIADGAEVAVCAGDKVTIRAVKVGWRDDARFEVKDGVAANERVAIDHVLGLDDGTSIREAK